MKKTIAFILSTIMIALCLSPMNTDAVTWGNWSGWSETAVQASDTRQVEKKTQYRYATRTATWEQTGSGNYDYAASWTGGFNKNHSLYTKYNKTKKSSSETSTQKTVYKDPVTVGYIYYHWCMGKKLEKTYNRTIESYKTATHATFHAFYSTANLALTESANARKKDNYNVCQDTYWWLKERITIKRQAYTTYKKVYSSWSSWSSWQDSSVSSTDLRQVQTRTVYRYRDLIDSSSGGDSSEGTSDKPSSGDNPSGGTTKPSSGSNPSGGTTNKTTTKTATLNKKGTILSIKSPTAKTIVIKWKKLSGISGYQCYISKKKDFKMHTIQRFYGKKKTKATIKNCPSKKTFYAKLRPYKKKDGKKIYGKWSAVKKVKVK